MVTHHWWGSRAPWYTSVANGSGVEGGGQGKAPLANTTGMGHAPPHIKVANGHTPPPITRICELHPQPPLDSYQETKERHPIVYSEKMPAHIGSI